MYNLLLIIQYITIVGLFAETCIVFRRRKNPLHNYLLFSCISILINSVGYLLQLEATTKDVYITALQFSYLGRIWVALALFFFVSELCNMQLPLWSRITLVSAHVIIYASILTLRSSNLYYKTTSFMLDGEFPKFTHTNGIMHHFLMMLVICYMVVGFTMLIKTFRKEHSAVAKKRIVMVILSVVFLSFFVILNIVVSAVSINRFDFTAFGYPITTVFMFIAILRCDLLGTKEIAKEVMIDRIPEGIIAVDTKGVVQYFNEPAKKMFPNLQTSNEKIPEIIDETLSSGKKLTINEHIYRLEKNALLRSGENFGDLYALVDETEHYRYMRELEKQKRLADSANQAKSAFLANMSHDIRTPINAVLSMNEMILRECSDDNILNYAEKIRCASNSLLGLVNDILDFSKIEAGKLNIIPVDYDLTSLLNDLINILQPKAEAKGLELKTVIDENIPKLLHGDEIRLKQIITNILTNAVKYTKTGHVEISVGFEKIDEKNIFLKVGVTDTGIGIKQEDIPKLFSKFERIEEKRNRSIEGTGLGINITQQLLSMMGSNLEVKSEYGKGSTFSFSLTQEVIKWETIGNFDEAFVRSLANRKQYQEKFTAPKANVLIVDDTPMNLEVFVNLLKKTLIQIDTAQSGAECLAFTAKKKYDIIFLDHMMPDKDGIETLEELRAMPENLNKETPAICFTANAISGARKTYISAGFNDYLTKPVEPDKLEKMLMDYLPKDKVRTIDCTNVELNTTALLPDFLIKNDEIALKEGIKNCGDESMYLSTLKTYASSIITQCDEIEQYWENKDIVNLTVKIHAIKSTSRLIGAIRISSLAEDIEKAGNAKDIAFISSHIEEMLTRCRGLGKQLSSLLYKGDLPLITENELNEAYTLIREFLSVDDYSSVLEIIENLKNYAYPKEEKERCKKLIKAASEFDYDLISNIMLEGA
ncbi:MAG: response regulator [Clostridiales bacterium]|nr:response regulator [Clostridiales bacterium]